MEIAQTDTSLPQHNGKGVVERLLSGKRGEREFSNIFICRLSGGFVHGVHIRCRNGDLLANPVTFQTVQQASQFVRKLGKKCQIVALLPKSHYLIKVLELPKVGPKEVRGILELEIEALLPAEFGDAEISYRRLEDSQQASLRFEVYISRRSTLKEYTTSLESFGIRADLILPSAAVWSRLLGYRKHINLLVVGAESDGLGEAAFLQPDRSLSIRSTGGSNGQPSSVASEKVLVESLRALKAHFDPSNSPLIIGWAGDKCPQDVGGTVVFENAADLFGGLSPQIAEPANSDPFVSLAGLTLASLDGQTNIKSSNLLPREITRARDRRSTVRNLAAAVAATLISMTCLYAALRVAIVRYEQVSGGLAEKTALIKAEGQAIGWRIDQLKAIYAAKATGKDFQEILAGLYEATPEGITYSNVELRDSGEVLLRGQASSMALPFILPEKLENQPAFSRVLLKDAGQVNRAGGSISEFRIDCYLERRGGQ